MEKMPSIGQFRNAVREVRERCKYEDISLPKLRFMGTIKLHGTNAGIAYRNGDISYQSKNRVIKIGDDHAGFAAHMNKHEKSVGWLIDEVKSIFSLTEQDEFTIYGEWCGEGIQKGVGITGLPKMFVIFALKINGVWKTIMDRNFNINNRT